MPPKRIKFVVKKKPEETAKPKKKIKFVVKKQAKQPMPKPQKLSLLLKRKKCPSHKKKKKFVVLPNEIEYEAFGGGTLEESLKRDDLGGENISFTARLLLMPIEDENKFIVGWNKSFKKRKAEIKKKYEKSIK